jgi:hypothetical protein
MGLAISKDYAGISTYTIGALSSYRSRSQATAVANHNDAGQVQDTVELSKDGRLAVADLLSDLMLPTEENVRKLSAQLSRDLGSLLTNAGISAEPPITFSTGYSGEIVVEGNRPDKEQILKAVNADEKVSQEIRNTAAISSHAAGMAESLEFQREYRASNDPEAVVAKYSHLFTSGQRSHHTALVFDGHGIDVMSDGKTWLSYQA